MKKYRAVVFDLDGTLVDSLGDLACTVNLLCKEAGLPPHSLAEYRQFIGNGAGVLLQKAFGFSEPEEVSEELLVKFKDLYAEHLLDTTALYEGMDLWLRFLQEKGIYFAVFTNKPQHSAEKILHTLTTDFLPTPICGNKSDKKRKPEPDVLWEILSDWGVEPSECLYVGDSDVDMLTAQNAKTDVLAAGWGFRGKEELLQYDPTYYFETVKEAFLAFSSVYKEENV